MKLLLVVASGLALALAVAVPQAVARPLPPHAAAHRSGRSIADSGIRLPLPHHWYGLVVYGGIGSSPYGVGELVVANYPLPQTAGECEHPLPELTRHQVLLRIYDYGSGTEAGAWRAGGLDLGRVLFHGRFVVVDGVFGTRHPSTTTLDRVDRLLHGAVAT